MSLNNLLQFYAAAHERIAEATDDLRADQLERSLMAASAAIATQQAQAATDKLLALVNQVYAPPPQSVAPMTELADLMTRLGAEPKCRHPADEDYAHPSPLYGVDLGPEEPVLEPEDAEADQRMRDEIAAMQRNQTGMFDVGAEEEVGE